MKYGLKDEVVNKIKKCLYKINNIEEAILYGSRAMGNYRNGSDIDLTLKGESLTISDLFSLENDIDDLMLPYTFDISIYDHINNQELLDHISRVGQQFFKREDFKSILKHKRVNHSQ